MPYKLSADGTTQLVGKQQLVLGRQAFQRTDDATENMAINGTAGGTPTLIWNGDDAAWTHEGQGTPETYAAHSGTYGLDSGSRLKDEWSRFNAGSNLDIGGSYSTVEFWMQPKAFPASSELKINWQKLDNSNNGSTLKVNDYVSNFDLDVWQLVSIPIADFKLTADVAKLVLTYAKKDGQQLYFDDIDLHPSGGGGLGPKEFRVQSPVGKAWHVERVVLVISAGDTGWNSVAFANIAAGLASGLLLKYHKIGAEPETYWTVNCKNNIELFGNFIVVNDVNFADSDMLVVLSLEPNLSSVLLIDDDEVLDFVVRDDLSSLTRVRAFLHYGEEDVVSG